MLSSSLDSLLTLSKMASPQKLYDYDCMTVAVFGVAAKQCARVSVLLKWVRVRKIFCSSHIKNILVCKKSRFNLENLVYFIGTF